MKKKILLRRIISKSFQQNNLALHSAGWPLRKITAGESWQHYPENICFWIHNMYERVSLLAHTEPLCLPGCPESTEGPGSGLVPGPSTCWPTRLSEENGSSAVTDEGSSVGAVACLGWFPASWMEQNATKMVKGTNMMRSRHNSRYELEKRNELYNSHDCVW